MDQDSDIDEQIDETSPPGDPDEAVDDQTGAHKISKLSVCQEYLRPRSIQLLLEDSNHSIVCCMCPG